MYCNFILEHNNLKCTECGFTIPYTEGKVYRECIPVTQKPPNKLNLMQKLKNLNSAGEEWVENNNEIVKNETAEARYKICQSCPNFNNNRCNLCGCFMSLKTLLGTSRCPDNPPRW